MIVAFDFDGTIASGDFYPAVGPIDPLAVRVLGHLKAVGHQIILHTCREGQQLVDALHGAKRHGIEFDAVNAQVRDCAAFGRKPFAHLYVDDRAWPLAGEPIDWQTLDRWFAANGWYEEVQR